VRFKPTLDACLERLVKAVGSELPEYGRDLAIDASDLPAYANGQRFVSKNGPERERFSDPDASWGHRSAVSTRKGGGFYGYRLHMAACARTDLPVAWQVETAKRNESTLADHLLPRVRERVNPETAALDKGYDVTPVYDACEAHGVLPIIPLRKVKSNTPPGPPVCEHGTWTFAGADFKNRRTKWRCPNAGVAHDGQLPLACSPASVWIKGRQAKPARPAKLQAVRRPLPGPRRRRAGVRTLEERLRALPAQDARDRARGAPHRPRNARPPRLRARQGASRPARGVGRAPSR
jgi:hypothetical protein